MSVSAGFDPSTDIAVANVLSNVRVHSFLVVVAGD
jgi:hypothetical protein